MAKKKKDAVIHISRRGVFIWSTLILFIAGWMFVLGILVGRGSAPMDLDAGKLEQELKTLKAAMAKKAQAQVDAHTGTGSAETPELGFYKALKENRGRPKMKMPPKKQAKAAPAPKPVKPAQVAAKPKPAPKPVAQKSPSTKPTRAKGRFTVQVAAVRDAGNAESLVNDLRKQGYAAYQVRVAVPGKGAWHRVRVGAYDNRAAADQMTKKLKAQKINAMVVGTN